MNPDTITPERLTRARALWEAAIELPIGDRTAFLDRETSDDPDLRHFVLRLLMAHESTGDIFNRPLHEQLEQVIRLPAASLLGRTLGAYRVTGEVGQGGMGAVYEAARHDDQFRQRVAIKVVQRDIDSAVTLARFRRERQFLASLTHPHIATLHDGGLMSDGREPYLVMEFVDGIADHRVVQRALAAARSAPRGLFRQVCAAVHHAHRNLIIHRDLKPGNILVTGDGN